MTYPFYSDDELWRSGFIRKPKDRVSSVKFERMVYEAALVAQERRRLFTEKRDWAIANRGLAEALGHCYEDCPIGDDETRQVAYLIFCLVEHRRWMDDV